MNNGSYSSREPLLTSSSSSSSSRLMIRIKRNGEEREELTSDSNDNAAPTSSSAAKRRFKKQQQQQQHSSRLAKGTTSRLRSNATHLVQNFGDFLASRNVINKESSYDKIVNSNSRLQQQQQPIKTAQCQGPYLQQHQQQHYKRSRVTHLLSALLSRHQHNKASLLVSLLRAPTVLAALFSLLLVASLMILYALSFCHHLDTAETIHNNNHHHQQQQQQEAHHRINSRQLAAIIAAAEWPNEAQHQSADNDFSRALTVQTECGKWVGELEGRAIAFRAIPYASPPIGSRRWTRPRPVWQDEQLCQANATNESRNWRARANSGHCAQLSPVTRRFSGHEDCLYLDIYTPRLNQVEKLPVMVYIHGGFLTFGSSGSGQVNWLKGRPSAALASELNVVLVAFNYRLQALGFITLVQLAQNNGPDGSEGNYGLWDQLAALNWIKRNIESFAGDPNNIVLFGPDSASALPLALMSRRGDSVSDGALVGSQPFAITTFQSREKVEVEEEDIKATSPLQQQQSARDLFRAVWLTNPTVYYELPYEAASRHYERLFLGQSSCLRAAAAIPLNGSTNNNKNSNNSNSDRDQSEQTLRCLMSLSAEQVVRQYLGKDDPSYRLDDQNSLPIHGIFADQFVTVDQELVQDSFPFIRSSQPKADSTTTLAAANETSRAHYRSSGLAAAPTNQLANQAANCFATNCLTNLGGKDVLLGSTAQAVEFWPCPRNLHQWTWQDFENYVATSLNSFITDTYKKANQLYAVPAKQQQQQQSSSSSSLSTSNSSSSSSDRYQAPPSETYLSMVSDIRQTCPVNELSSTLTQRHHRVHRYIVETRPSTLSRQQLHQENQQQQQQRSTTDQSEDDVSYLFDQAHHKPQYAYHTWDLFAFFGFEFDPNFRPSKQDIQFQSQIRQLVASFVHNKHPLPASFSGGRDRHLQDRDDEQQNKLSINAHESYNRKRLYTLFDADGNTRQVSGEYKANECRMWRKHLNRSYAWTS